MARGITAQEVRDAADQLLAAGERPTAERVRLALGRGSPNTIGPMLETWWTTLAQRLRAQLALPDVPAELGSAFAEVWAQALAAGRAHAEGLVAPERAALAEVLGRTEAAAAAQQATLAERDAQLQLAQAAQRGLEAALAISEQRAADIKAELDALNASHDALVRRREALDARLAKAQATAEAERAAATAERDRLQALLNQVHDRAYTEVDRTRQEIKGLKAQLAQSAREHAAALRASDKRANTAEGALAKAQRDLAAARARPAKPRPARRRLTS